MQSQKIQSNFAGKKLKRGPVYRNIYQSEKRRVQLSEKTLKIIDEKSKREKLYWKIETEEEKEKIEYRSERWSRYPDVDLSCKYWIFIQKDANNYETGFVKILLKEKSEKTGFFETDIVAKNEKDWKYYAKGRK